MLENLESRVGQDYMCTKYKRTECDVLHTTFANQKISQVLFRILQKICAQKTQANHRQIEQT